ncbi:hypothetical protein GQX73_g1629 [Xylaria multiplex]|uniref:DUF7708 domain-containing protein n=1 Tax=Xylaria multiplex TaxID=323545 RepID=A0A7C8ITP7_9PEZI|nr:hypothetical protein GQX73_g1629 [Xylaria multiplex]
MSFPAALERIRLQTLSVTERSRLDEPFQIALNALRQHAPEDFVEKVDQWGTIEDVVCQIRIAETKYSSQQKGKAWKWVTKLAGKITVYSDVLTVIAQHHPEYVSLVWGAFKFVFVGVINHEVLIKELCKAMTRIADVVRHVQVQCLLYPTDEVVDHMRDLYSHIMSFAVRAVEWYQKKKIARALAAFTSPYQLKFQDIVEEIYETSRRIDRWAITMNHIEIRQMRQQLIETGKALELAHLERREMCQLVTDLKGLVSHYSQLQYSGMLNTNQRLSEIQFSQIHSFISTSSIPRPDLVRQSYNARRNRRRQANSGHLTSQLWISDMKEWGDKWISTQILVQGSFKTRHEIRDFAANTIDLIQEAKVPVVWALDPRAELLPDHQFNTSDVLKYLASQVLQINHSAFTERHASISSARFHSAAKETEWLELIGSMLQDMNQLYFIIDLDLVVRSGGTAIEWLGYFAKVSDDLKIRNIRTIVKVAFICTSRCVVETLPPETKSIRLDTMVSGRVKGHARKVKRRKQRLSRSKLISAVEEGLQ